jgi:hypothetical protein
VAGMGWKQWVRERLDVDEFQGYVQDQTVMRFASAAARDAVLLAPSDGMTVYLEDEDRLLHREGGAFWRPVDGHWGTYGIVNAWPSSARAGDRLWCTDAKCMYAHDGSEWRQASVSVFANFAAIETFRAAVNSSGGATVDKLHNGFQAYDADTNTLWVASGGASSTSIWDHASGKAAGTIVTEVTATAAGFTTSSGFTVTTLYARRIGGMGYLDAVVQRTGAAITVPADGNVANTQVFTVPADLRPSINVPMVSGSGGSMAIGGLTSAGAVNLYSVAPGTSLATGASFQLGTGFFPLADPALSYLAASAFD